MGTVVKLWPRGSASAVRALAPADAALMGVMRDLLGAVVRDRRISVSDVSVYEDPRGRGTVAAATIRVFGLAPLTVIAPTGHDGVAADDVLAVAYQVAVCLADECAPERAMARECPLATPRAAFEEAIHEITGRMTALAADPRRNAAPLKATMRELGMADIALQLSDALWGAMAAFGQTALWARGELAEI